MVIILFKKYRFIGETNNKGETYWKVQVRTNIFMWKNLVVDDWNEKTKPYLCNSLSVSFDKKEDAIYLLDEWKKKISYVKPNIIIEYVP